jgi:hypothetical protein
MRWLFGALLIVILAFSSQSAFCGETSGWIDAVGS